MSDVMGIRERLRERRLALGMSQKAVERRTGIPQTTLSRVETGPRLLPTRYVASLAKALAMPVEEIAAIATPADRPRIQPQVCEVPRGLTPPLDFERMLLSGTPSTLRERAVRWEATPVEPILTRLYAEAAS